jgi:hypothetical protein
MRLAEYFAGRPGNLREALAGQVLPRPTVKIVGDVASRFLESHRDLVPPASVFSLSGAWLYGPQGWIVAPGDVFLIDASFEGNVPEKPVSEHLIYRARRGKAPSKRRLAGRCLSLASDYAIGGFGHFIHDSLTRLLLVEASGMNVAEFDWVYLPRPATPVVEAMVARLGIAPGRLLNYEAGVDLWSEELTATSFPGVPGHISRPYSDFLRSKFAPTPRRRDRRVYLSRHGYRRNFSNLKEVEDVLGRNGFEEVRPHEDAETLQKCTEAAFVFCIEGANFFNAAFCPAGTRVMLVFPDRLPHAVPYALTLAEAAGFQTWLIGGGTVGPSDVDGGIADVYLDPTRLETAIQQMISAQSEVYAPR